jgi:hypothetical protein
MNLRLKQDGEYQTCSSCGIKIPYRGKLHLHDCPAIKKSTRGPGTKLKNFLTRFGITEDWYKMMKAEIGLLPNCNCKKREDLLNAAWAGFQAGGWAEARRRWNEVSSTA